MAHKLHKWIGIAILILANAGLFYATARRASLVIVEQDLIQFPWMLASVLLVLVSGGVALLARGFTRRSWILLSGTLVLMALVAGGICGIVAQSPTFSPSSHQSPKSRP